LRGFGAKIVRKAFGAAAEKDEFAGGAVADITEPFGELVRGELLSGGVEKNDGCGGIEFQFAESWGGGVSQLGDLKIGVAADAGSVIVNESTAFPAARFAQHKEADFHGDSEAYLKSGCGVRGSKSEEGSFRPLRVLQDEDILNFSVAAEMRLAARALAVGGVGFGFGGGAGRAIISDAEAFGIAPEAFEIVILAGAFAEDVDNEIAVIEQEPFGGAGFAFTMRKMTAVLVQALFNSLGDGAELRLALAGAEDEILGEGACLAQVKDDDIECVFILGRFDGEANF